MKKNIYEDTIMRRIKSFFEFGTIRIQKLLHMAQISSLGLLLSLITAPLLDKYSFELNKKEPFYLTFLKLNLEIIILIFVLYYIRKATKILPFILNFDSSYNPYRKSSDGESLVGNTVSMAIVYANFLTKLKAKIKYVGYNLF